MRVNAPADFAIALEMYYGKVELATEDIRKLFSCSASSANKLKKIARAKMEEESRLAWSSTCVLTEVAFRAWQIDISDIEKRVAKLQKLKEKAVI